LKKFSDNSWTTSSKEFKEFVNGKNGFLVRFDIENGPYTGFPHHCHCDNHTREHIGEHVLALQLFKKSYDT